jgi:hypothetical protein
MEQQVLDVTVELCGLVGDSAEASAFRRYQHGIQQVADLAGMPMDQMNYLTPRILGDMRTLAIWEQMRLITPPVAEATDYLRALAGAALPLLGLEAVACDFPALYYPALLVDERPADPFAKDSPVGQDLFRAIQGNGHWTAVPTPRTVRQHLPFLPAAGWREFQSQLAAHYSAGSRLRKSLQRLAAVLSESDAARAAGETYATLLADAEAIRVGQQIQADFAAFSRTRLRGARYEQLSRLAVEFVRARYLDLMVPAELRRYYQAVRGFAWQVFLAKACIVSATLDWPLLDFTAEAFGTASVYVDRDSTYTDVYTQLGERSSSVLDCSVVRLPRSVSAPGLHLIRDRQMNWFADGTGASWSRLEWLGEPRSQQS